MNGYLLTLLPLLSLLFLVAAAPVSLDFNASNLNPNLEKLSSQNLPKVQNKARITILDIGRLLVKINGNGKNFEYIPTITLIEDGPSKIIFDTGLPTDKKSSNRMLKALKQRGFLPTAIDKVIISHAHLDHLGHASIFTNAKIFHGDHMFDGFSLTYIGTYEFGGYNLTENIRIVPTPGHTAVCISALIKNAEVRNSSSVQSVGLVAITGDLFFKVEDLKDSTIWKSAALDITKQEQSRKEILCKVDYIIPGHGPMFKVPAAQKCGCPKCIEVTPGDTFFDLCIKKLKSTMKSCISHSDIPNPDKIYPGEQVCA